VRRDPTPTPERRNEEQAVRRTLAQFVEAQENLDADTYARVYPGANKSRVAASFANLRSQKLTLDIESVRVTGNRAEVSAYERRVAQPQVGSEQRVNGARRFTLEKRGDSWFITAIR
jgi:hypothetical protein